MSIRSPRDPWLKASNRTLPKQDMSTDDMLVVVLLDVFHTSFAHLVEVGLQPFLGAVLIHALCWFLFEGQRKVRLGDEGMCHAYQVHIMRVAEPAVVCETSLAAKLAVMSKSTVDIAASLP